MMNFKVIALNSVRRPNKVCINLLAGLCEVIYATKLKITIPSKVSVS